MLQIDQQNREQAINPNKSFIIQAPAGSGKTSLLIQRYLVLLTKVEKPEEILAITFTRKASCEMRTRILQALHHAFNDPAPNDPHKHKIWNLAKAALAHNQKMDWNLMENPNRMRIQTIDSLCGQLAKQMPLSSHLGATINILEQQEQTACYQQAVRNLLISLDNKDISSNAALADLLLYLDNDFQKAEKLLVNMLAKRDQWLPHIAKQNRSHKLRCIMENNLANVIAENVVNCRKNFPQGLLAETKFLVEYANSESLDLDTLVSWQKIAKVLLTTEQTWRKKVDARNGFLSESAGKTKEQKILFKTMKQRAEDLLQQLTPHEEIRSDLEALLKSPHAQYSDQQWNIILGLTIILKSLATDYLPQIFRESRAVDYIETALAAERALEQDGIPTDLALTLDYKIKHILVDEFQDTSTTQYRLLEKLTAGWQLDDGRTLFLVGDPMQSIYKFREAKVGLFLRTKQQQRINSIPLIPLTLSANFRSEQHLVDWVNKTLVDIFPQTENIDYGAVAFIPSEAASNINIPTKIKSYCFSEPAEEAQQIVSIIRQTEPNNTIAILVRNRSHLNAILPTLKQEKIAYQAVELETLNDSTVITDLFTLTRALLNLADHISWLALLRAPWCGLTLTDIHTLVINTPKEQPLWTALINYQTLNLSSDAKTRLAHLTSILIASLAARSKQPLRHWIKNTWIALNGHLYLNTHELENAEKYFQLLDAQDKGSYIEDLTFLEQRLKTLYIDAQNEVQEANKIQVMTIHKAKGLEFDSVIIPALERKQRSTEQELLMWTERTNILGGEIGELILAPINEAGKENDPIYKYLRFENGQKEINELSRLLYVAVTRAKKELHLLACNGDKLPIAGSLLKQLWPHFSNMPKTTTITAVKITNNEEIKPNQLSRIPIEKIIENNVTEKTTKTCLALEGAKINLFEFSNRIAASIGTIIHETLQYLSTINLDNWLEKNLTAYKKIWRTKLITSGIFDNLDEHIDKITHAITTTIEDPQGRWILDNNHQEARSEYPLTIILNDTPQNFIIDRTFVDKGIRWIIDYKTAIPYEEELYVFLNRQKELYQAQLRRYAKIITAIDNRPINTALYFPLLPKMLLISIQQCQ